MKQSFSKTIFCLVMLFILFVSTVSAANLEEKKEELRNKTTSTLEKLYKQQPSARNVIANANGYAVFNNTGMKLGIFGSAHGRGMAVNNITGQEVYMRMKEFQAGFGLGVKEYAIIFVFANQDVFNSFTNNGWEFGGQATAAANDSVTGDSVEGALSVTPGMWIYQITTKGLALELAVKGTNYYRDSSFDEEKNK